MRVDTLAARYEQRMIRHRAMTIARTETMGALNAGALEGYLQAQDKGRLPLDAVKKWKAAPSELRPPRCPICSQLDGNEVPLRGTFCNGSAAPPAHPRCRCTIVAKAPMPVRNVGAAVAPQSPKREPKAPVAESLRPSPVPPPTWADVARLRNVGGQLAPAERAAAARYACACLEGPVFDSRDVVWPDEEAGGTR